MVRLQFAIELKYEIGDHASDFIFNIHAAKTRCQSVVTEQLYISQPVLPVIYTHPTYGTRYMRLKADPGQLTVRYDATVDIAHHFESPARLAEVPISQLPAETLPISIRVATANPTDCTSSRSANLAICGKAIGGSRRYKTGCGSGRHSCREARMSTRRRSIRSSSRPACAVTSPI